MNQQKVFKSGPLTLEVTDSEPDITVRWLGKSAERDPGKFIAPCREAVTPARQVTP